MDYLGAGRYCCSPLTRVFMPGHSLDARCIVWRLPGISAILWIGRPPQVGSKVIHRVTVYMVWYESLLIPHNEAVKPFISSIYARRRIPCRHIPTASNGPFVYILVYQRKCGSFQGRNLYWQFSGHTMGWIRSAYTICLVVVLRTLVTLRSSGGNLNRGASD